jgi:hydrogenase expression/formation protein HypC
VTSEPPTSAACEADHCITCADEGVPMTVVRIDSDTALAECTDEAGETSEVETALVAALTHGDRVLVHAGVAIAMLEPEDAA